MYYDYNIVYIMSAGTTNTCMAKETAEWNQMGKGPVNKASGCKEVNKKKVLLSEDKWTYKTTK